MTAAQDDHQHRTGQPRPGRGLVILGVAAAACVTALVLVWLLRSGPAEWRYELKVKAARGGVVPMGGYATVAMGPGTLARDAGVSIGRVDDSHLAVREGCSVRSLGDPFEVVIGADLRASAILTARYDDTRLPAGHGAASVKMAFFDRARDEWVPVPSRPDAAQRAVSADTSLGGSAIWMPVTTVAPIAEKG